MLHAKFFLAFEVPQSKEVAIAMIYWETLEIISEEIDSDLNRFGTQIYFGVHIPTPTQLKDNYIDTGGMQRCLDRMSIQYAYFSEAA